MLKTRCISSGVDAAKILHPREDGRHGPTVVSDEGVGGGG